MLCMPAFWQQSMLDLTGDVAYVVIDKGNEKVQPDKQLNTTDHYHSRSGRNAGFDTRHPPHQTVNGSGCNQD